ncbi:hypothetical protein DH2020_042608 [Rehmannia glutinosa]|uniref:Pentatricopeptide repeat-containing protein n=1 Tax=Rehmannia glutinosa TaxID=99300 RepID=A0ABR0ULZ8_REHGL
MVCPLPCASLCMLSSFNIEQRHGSHISSKPISESPKTELFHKFNSPFELKQVHTLVIKTVDQPETFIWNSCLRDFAESDSPFDAILLFYQMRRYNVLPDSFTCSFVLKACVRLQYLFHGRIIHAFVEKLGLQLNLVLLNVIVHLYASCGRINDAILLFDKMPQRDVVTWNTMITQLVKMGDIDSAYKMFVQMPDRNLRSWTAMIAGFVQCGKPKEAIALFTKMEEVGLKPNEVTVVAVLAACADVGALHLGRRIHDYSDKRGFTRNIHISNTLIDMYIKCGCLKAACDVFKNMKERTIVSWSAMIQGLAIHGKAKEALELFSEMIYTGMKPNGVTFLGLLNACSHMGLINEGRSFFASMTKYYGIIPCIEHYGCMVDLLSRAGLLEEAHELIEQMPIKPNAAVWGCPSWWMQKAKKWEDAAKVRKMMRNRGLKRQLVGVQLLLAGTVHEFVAGDETHPQSKDIFKMWNHLLVYMRLKGYVPNTSVVLLDIEEEEKRRFCFATCQIGTDLWKSKRSKKKVKSKGKRMISAKKRKEIRRKGFVVTLDKNTPANEKLSFVPNFTTKLQQTLDIMQIANQK